MEGLPVDPTATDPGIVTQIVSSQFGILVLLEFPSPIKDRVRDRAIRTLDSHAVVVQC
jgi:hypothetical protein